MRRSSGNRSRQGLPSRATFAAAGDPNAAGLPAWAAFEPSKQPFQFLSSTILSLEGYKRAQCDFIDTIRPL